MGQVLPYRPPALGRGAGPSGGKDPGATARGILLALALSTLCWVGLALVVPRLW
jgi:hypothetical protein